MNAMFADLAERTRQRNREARTYKAEERRRVLGLCDAIQIAVAAGQRDRTMTLLAEMRTLVDSAIAKRAVGAPVVTRSLTPAQPPASALAERHR